MFFDGNQNTASLSIFPVTSVDMKMIMCVKNFTIKNVTVKPRFREYNYVGGASVNGRRKLSSLTDNTSYVGVENGYMSRR